MQKALEIDALSAGYGGERAVDSISLDVERGDLLGIVGPNGAGKTTLFRAILGLQDYDGDVGICGRRGSDRLDLLPFVGYVPQRVSFERSFPATVRDIVTMGIVSQRNIDKCVRLLAEAGYEWNRSYRSMNNAERVNSALDAVNVAHLADKRIGEISGGETQRVFIAKSLVNDPLLLILDEPATSVDVAVQNMFYDVITRLNKTGITIVWSSHDLDAISRVATKVACMNRSLSFHGGKNEFFADENAVREYTESAMQAHMHGHSEHDS